MYIKKMKKLMDYRIFVSFTMTLVLSLLYLNNLNADDITQDGAYLLTYTNNNVVEDHIQAYFEKLQTNFAEHKLELNVAAYDRGNSTGDIHVDFRADYDGSGVIIGQFIVVAIPDSPLASLSPVLVHDDGMLFSGSPKTEADLSTALFFYIHGQCDLADEYFQNADIPPSEPNQNYFQPALSFFQGECVLQKKDFKAAVNYFQEASSDNPDRRPYLSAKLNLAWVYLQLDNEDAAFDILAPLPALADEFGWDEDEKTYILTKRAQLYALTERYDDAIADLSTAIELPSDDTPVLYLLRGKMYLAQYEWDSALADYNKAIEIDPTYSDAYYERGVLYYSILQTGVELRTEAFDDFHRYLELAPDGDHAADAARYTAQIEKELEALNG